MSEAGVNQATEADPLGPADRACSGTLNLAT